MYTAASLQENVLAMYNLANCYQNGVGVEKDEKEAFSWYERASEYGHADSICALAVCYNEGIGIEINKSKAVELFKKSSESGSLMGMFQHGLLVDKGAEGVNPDRELAFELFKRSAESGLSLAQYHLGISYMTGKGTDKDINEGFKYLLLAAQQEFPDAIYRIGSCYESGLGVQINEKVAFEYFKKASKLNAPTACYRLGLCYEENIGVEENEENIKFAFESYLKGANLGHSGCQYNIGVCYGQGLGTEKNIEKAFEFFEKSSKQNDLQAIHVLAGYYFNGIFVKENQIEGFKLWKIGATKGDFNSMFELYNCFLLGKGTGKDTKEAAIWLQKSAFEGSTRGQLKLSECYKKGLRGFNQDLKDSKKWYEKAIEENQEGIEIPSYEEL